MRLKSLKLQNIRSYVEETITFSEGSQLLAGDIGAGKSTVLLAIEYALFGTKRGELETSSLLRNGSHAGRIELVFDLNGKEIKIHQQPLLVVPEYLYFGVFPELERSTHGPRFVSKHSPGFELFQNKARQYLTTKNGT